jgi:hypothetical protein
MRTITVATGMNAPNGFGVQKYSNNEDWNTVNGSAPNEVNATRWLRKTTPDKSKLSPLAAWLVEHVPEYCGGRMPAFNHDERVRCYNGKTEADRLREDAECGICHSMGYRGSVEKARKYAEGFIRCYNLENEPTRIDDWLFDRIAFEESDEDYWNRQAEKMLAVGTIRVVIGDAEWRAEQ